MCRHEGVAILIQVPGKRHYQNIVWLGHLEGNIEAIAQSFPCSFFPVAEISLHDTNKDVQPAVSLRLRSTLICSSATPFGFSQNSTMRPVRSAFNSPKLEATSGAHAMTEIVTSAFVSTWRARRSR